MYEIKERKHFKCITSLCFWGVVSPRAYLFVFKSLTMLLKLALNMKASCLGLLSAGIIDKHCHAQLCLLTF